MKKLFLGITAIALLSAALSSCSLEKRVYQDGYHISWKNGHSAFSETTQTKEINSAEKETIQSNSGIKIPNVHTAETISANSNQVNPIIFYPEKQPFVSSHTDTIVPTPSTQQDEYFTNTYTVPNRPETLQDTKLANWALGLGIGALSTPAWATILLGLLSVFTTFSWTFFGFYILFAVLIFLALEITSISLAKRFLRLHGKDPNYRKYRRRAITGLILAAIYPALLITNIILALILSI